MRHILTCDELVGRWRSIPPWQPSTPTPTTELDVGYSPPDAAATPWTRAEAETRRRSDLLAVNRAQSTGDLMSRRSSPSGIAVPCTSAPDPRSRKPKNLTTHPDVVITTGTNVWSGLDVVVEGAAVRVTDDEQVGRTGDRPGRQSTARSGTSTSPAAPFATTATLPTSSLSSPRKIFAYDRDEPRLGHPLPLLTSARRSATNQTVCCDRPTDRTHRSTPPPIT